MGHNPPRFEWRARPYRGTRDQVFYELVVNRRPCGAVYWTKDDTGPPFYVGVVYGGRSVGRFSRRPEAIRAVEEAYGDFRWGPKGPK